MYQLLILAVLLLVPGVAWGACDCATSGGNGVAPPGTTYCDTGGAAISYTSAGSPTTSTITLTLGNNGTANNTYTCGQYANGDYWILGKGTPKGVEVASTTPAYAVRSCTGDTYKNQWYNGWDINPEFPGDNRLDGRRFMGYVGVPDNPVNGSSKKFETGNGPVSFIKTAGNPSHKTTVCDSKIPCTEPGGWAACVRFAGVWTFVNEIPDVTAAGGDNDGYTVDEFRPPYAGLSVEKPVGFNIDADFNTQAAVFGAVDLDRTAVAEDSNWTFEDAAERFRWPLLMFGRTSSGNAYNYYLLPSEPINVSGEAIADSIYGEERRLGHLGYALRFLFDDFDEWDANTAHLRPDDRTAEEQALINLTQSGIDLYGEALIGQMFCGGSRWTGSSYTRRFSPIDHPEMTEPASCYTMPGGHLGGPKVRAFISAFLLGDAQMQKWVAGTADMDVIKNGGGNSPDSDPSRSDRLVDHFITDGAVLRGSDGRPYYGYETDSNCGSSNYLNQAKNDAGRGDAMCDCIGKAYSARESNSFPYYYPLVHLLGVDAEALWNQDAFLEYASQWRSGTRGPSVGDPGNPEVAGVYCPVAPYDESYWTTSLDDNGNPKNHPFRVTSYRTEWGEEVWSVFGGSDPTPSGVSIQNATVTAPAACPYASTVAVTVEPKTALCDPVGVGADKMNYYLTCSDGTTTDSDLNSDLLTNTFFQTCPIAADNEDTNIQVSVTCVENAGGNVYSASTSLDVSCTSTTTPTIESLDVWKCGIDTNGDQQPDTPPSIVYADFANNDEIDKSMASECYAVCATANDGITDGTESIRWTHTFNGAQTSTQHKENTAPWCLNGEWGWYNNNEEEGPNCICYQTHRGDLSLVGTHTVTIEPFSADNQAGTQGTDYGPITFTVTDGTSSGESCEAPDPWNQP